MSKEKKTAIDKKDTDLVGIIGREKMDLLAGIVGESEWRAYRQTYGRASQLEVLPYPVQLDFELNGSCNLRCLMCPRSAESAVNKGRETWFPFETFKKIIDDGVGKGLRALNLSYINEPLIRDDLPMFVKYAREKGVCDVYFSTNGLLLTEKNTRELIEAGLCRIQVSIDAVTPQTYGQIRIGGNFEKVVENVHMLLRIREEMSSVIPLVRVNFVRTEVNRDELEMFAAYWKDKADMIGIQEMVKVRDGKLNGPGDKGDDKKRQDFKCSEPFKKLTITNNGLVLPCCALLAEDMPIGDIHTVDIEELWNNHEMQAMRKLHREGRYFDHPICKRCVEDSM